jgi:hypothetical protein
MRRIVNEVLFRGGPSDPVWFCAAQRQNAERDTATIRHSRLTR